MNKKWINKNVLITGASGFVGSNAAHFFSKSGATVTAVVSPRASKEKIQKSLGDIVSEIEIIGANLLDNRSVNNITKHKDIILHFAAVDGNGVFKNNYSADILSNNTRIMMNVLDASAKNKVKTLLLISSADLYVENMDTVITEETKIDINLNKNIDGYKLAKWFTELAAREYHKQYNLNTIIVRPSNIYGPRDEFENDERMRLIPVIIKKILLGQTISIWGDKNQIRSFLYVDDFLSICKKLLEKEIYNMPINIASTNSISLIALIEKIGKIVGKDYKVKVDEEMVINSSRRIFNLSLLTDKLGISDEISLEKGLLKTVQFYKKWYY